MVLLIFKLKFKLKIFNPDSFIRMLSILITDIIKNVYPGKPFDDGKKK